MKQPNGYIYARWGFWATLGWGVLITLVLLIIQRLIFGMYVGEYYPDHLQKYYENIPAVDVNQLFHEFQFNGTVHSIISFVIFFVSIALVIGIIKLKKGSSVRDYLALRLPGGRAVEIWIFVLFIFLTLANVLVLLLDKSVPPEFVRKLYLSAKPTWIIWVAGVFITPFFEELFFRGFLMSGLERTFVRPIGAVVISSMIWAAMYIQLDLYLVINTLILGIILGMARFHSGSIYLPIGLHMVVNFFTLLLTMNQLSAA